MMTDTDLLIASTFYRRLSSTPKTKPNDALRSRLVEFLVFNSIYQLKSCSPEVEKNHVERQVNLTIYGIYVVFSIKM